MGINKRGECPQCGGALNWYKIGGKHMPVCDECGWSPDSERAPKTLKIDVRERIGASGDFK